tara:strand:+ start:1484 stop:2635 length:1152 start_codon:yes stop_codon:yes gene_type:complete
MKKLLNIIFFVFIIYVLSGKVFATEEKTKIGLLVPLDGQSQNIGKSVLRAVNLAINKIDDPSLEIYPKNNFDNPDDNIKAAQELYDQGIRIFIGPIFDKNIKNLEKFSDAIFITFSNKSKRNKKNLIYAGVNATSQMATIKKFLDDNDIKKTICLIPESDFKEEVKNGISQTKINLKKVFYYDTKPTEITKRIEKITRYDVRKQNLLDEIKRIEDSDDPNKENKIKNLEKRDTLGKLGFDSVIISDFDESLKSVITSLIYTDVSTKRVYFITLNQWFDNSLLKEDSSQNIYFPSINKKNYDNFSEIFFKKFNSYPNQISFLSYDLVGLIYYLSKKNGLDDVDKIFSQKNVFKGKTGIFEIKDKKIRHVLNFYKVEKGKFIKIF